MSNKTHTLSELEQWMFAVVSDPGGARVGLDNAGIEHVDVCSATLDSVILPSKKLTSMERLDIYADMFYWRLVDILIDDFPATRHAMGDSDLFYRLAVDYLTAHPSKHYRLGPLGAQLSEFISESASVEHNRDFLSQLARLERCMEEVFDEKHQPPISPLEVQAVPQERWAGAKFHVIDAMRLEVFDFPVNAYLNAYKNDEQPPIPARSKSHVLIWRLNYDVWRTELDLMQAVLLASLAEGKTLGDAFEACAKFPEFDPNQLMDNLGSWFKEWTEDGLFYAITS